MTAVRSGIALAIGILALCWVALLNGYPLFGVDSVYYFRGFDYLAAKMMGTAPRWAGSYPFTWDAPEALFGAPAQALARVYETAPLHDRAILSGRSLYYGGLVYLGEIAGGFWLVVVVQAVAIALCVHLTLRRFVRRPVLITGITLVLLSVLTAAPFYTAQIIPDVFAALTILACGNLLLFASPMSWRERLAWVLILIVCAVVHTSHVLIVAIMASLALCWWAAQRGRPSLGQVALTGLALTSLALVAAIGGLMVENRAMTAATGHAPVRPPFVAARIIADGPGYRYLRDTCPASGWILCRYLETMPAQADQFLWQTPADGGVFSMADAQTKRAISAEEVPFILAVARHEPIGLAVAEMRNWATTLSRFRLGQFRVHESSKILLTHLTSPAESAAMQRSMAFTSALPTRPAAAIGYLTMGIACLYLSWLLWKRAPLNGAERQLRSLAIVLVGGVITNAAVCGMLSNPYDRYQARVVWLVPFAAFTLALYRQRPELRRPPETAIAATP
jgi:hypothetical protein